MEKVSPNVPQKIRLGTIKASFLQLSAMAIFSSNSVITERLDGRYEDLRPIGQPFGYQQMLAHDARQNRSVVIKSIRLEKSTTASDIDCFKRETHLLKSLDHPTIPRYLESFRLETAEGTALVLVQSDRGGQTLAQQVAAGKQHSEAEVRLIAKQLLQGLVHLHQKGLIHRDIRPSNITVSTSNRVTGTHQTTIQAAWLNLGTARPVSEQRPGTLVGTYGYVPIEQVRAQATFASDLYSLGATLIYLITGSHLGELPCNGLPVKFTCASTKISSDFQQWLNWLIEPQICDRPASAKQALGALNHLPLAMLKQRIWKPTKAQVMPVPITPGGRNRYQPFFTKIQSQRKLNAFRLTIRPPGLQSKQACQALPPLLFGSALLALALHMVDWFDFSPAMPSSLKGLAVIAAAGLGMMGATYGFRFLRNGLRQLDIALLRRIYIEIKDDVLLISQKHWLRSPSYLVNAKRENIYHISALSDGNAIRILTNHNRTEKSSSYYKLTIHDGAITQRDIRWLTSLLNDWYNSPVK
ncbi:protein kinase domain [Synechococcus sp. PCC 7335]|uniref:serine/threonine protein kinase n=1 Tax=Synechococcus sp. (strain ATCC 29403 / PCC 7335) TaxID=91464 RepID=UPI00017ECE92|nr:serine/threonine-protein kinase [Synechococcus sp. PCC 7335]EDX86526.1 protein kinase domain [Synechococcus sp. PCC 7335]